MKPFGKEIGTLEVIAGFVAIALLWSAIFTIGLVPHHLISFIGQASLFNAKAYLHFGYALSLVFVMLMTLYALRGKKHIAYAESAVIAGFGAYIWLLSKFKIEITYWGALSMLFLGVLMFTYVEQGEIDIRPFRRIKLVFCGLVVLLIPYMTGYAVAKNQQLAESRWEIHTSDSTLCGNILIATDSNVVIYNADVQEYELYPSQSLRIMGECKKADKV